MRSNTPHAIGALAARICERQTLFLPGGAPDDDLDNIADADEADLHALAAWRATSRAKQRAKARVLASRDLPGGMSFGEAALLRSLMADLTDDRRVGA